MHPGAERGAESGRSFALCCDGWFARRFQAVFDAKEILAFLMRFVFANNEPEELFGDIGSVIVQLHYLGFAQFEFALVKRVDRDILEPRLRQAKVGTDGAGYRYEDDRKRRDGVR